MMIMVIKSAGEEPVVACKKSLALRKAMRKVGLFLLLKSGRIPNVD